MDPWLRALAILVGLFVRPGTQDEDAPGTMASAISGSEGGRAMRTAQIRGVGLMTAVDLPAAALSSGTSAIHLGLRLLGVRPGDEGLPGLRRREGRGRRRERRLRLVPLRPDPSASRVGGARHGDPGRPRRHRAGGRRRDRRRRHPLPRGGPGRRAGRDALSRCWKTLPRIRSGRHATARCSCRCIQSVFQCCRQAGRS